MAIISAESQEMDGVAEDVPRRERHTSIELLCPRLLRVIIEVCCLGNGSG
jgi:hypothetical protein